MSRPTARAKDGKDPDENRLLKKQVADLKRELHLKNRSLEQLEDTVREITPLRRHLKRQTKARLRKIDDRAITALGSRNRYVPVVVDPARSNLADLRRADTENFRNHNRFAKRSAGLSLYLLGRRAGSNAANTLLGLKKV